MAEDLILKVTPAEVEAKATQIEANRMQMEGLMNEMSGLYTQLSTVFSSTSGDAFIEKYKSVDQEIKDSLTNLKTHVDHLKTVAKTYEETETEHKNRTDALDTSNIF